MTDGLPTPQLWYHPYQSGVEYSLKNRADEAGRVLFLVGAAIMASVAVYAVWRPRSVFENVRIEHHELPIDDLASWLARVKTFTAVLPAPGPPPSRARCP